MKRCPKLIPLLLIALASVLSSACSRASEGPPVSDSEDVIVLSAGEPVRIAVAVAQSPAGIAAEGLAQLRGAELAAGDHGPITGLVRRYPVEIVSLDTACSPERGESVAREITGDPTIAGVIGHTCTDSCLAAVPIYEAADYTLISPSCGGPELTDRVMHSEAFLRTIYSDHAEGATAAEFAFYELGARRAALLHDSGLESQSMASAFEATFTALGGMVVATETTTSESDLRESLDALSTSGLDLLYAPLPPTQAVELASRRGSLPAGTPVLGGRHYLSTWFIEQAGADAEGLYAVGPLVTGPAYEELVDTYLRRYGEPPASPLLAHAYDATGLLIQAIQESSTAGRRWLAIDRRALREAIYNTTTYQGVTGAITCTDIGDCSSKTIAISQVQGGAWQAVFVP